MLLLKWQFQFPYCTWEFKTAISILLDCTTRFQFPYCTWEFKLRTIKRLHTRAHGFNSHTARGSSNLLMSILSRRRKFQFPYCTWEFKLRKARYYVSMTKFQFPYCTWEFKIVEHGSHWEFAAFQFPYCTWEFKPEQSTPAFLVC